jgi:hypothetical protein
MKNMHRDGRRASISLSFSFRSSVYRADGTTRTRPPVARPTRYFEFVSYQAVAGVAVLSTTSLPFVAVRTDPDSIPTFQNP